MEALHNMHVSWNSKIIGKKLSYNARIKSGKQFIATTKLCHDVPTHLPYLHISHVKTAALNPMEITLDLKTHPDQPRIHIFINLVWRKILACIYIHRQQKTALSCDNYGRRSLSITPYRLNVTTKLQNSNYATGASQTACRQSYSSSPI
jgi:hypothetical protein